MFDESVKLTSHEESCFSCALIFSEESRILSFPGAAVVSPDGKPCSDSCRRSTLGDGAVDRSSDCAFALRARLALVVGRAGHDVLVEVGGAEDGHAVVWRVANAARLDVSLITR